MEKEITTPEYYPLSLNALLHACNQKSNRDPVLNLSDDDVESCLSNLQKTGLVTRLQGGRVERWKKAQRIEAAAVFISLLGIGLAVFCGILPTELRFLPFEMLCFVVLLWPALPPSSVARSLGYCRTLIGAPEVPVR